MGALAPLKRYLRGFASWAAGDYLPIAFGGTGATDAVSARASLATGRNLIVNGNFAINQRQKSGTVTLTSGTGVRYGHDKWRAGANGCTYTFAASGLDTTLTISAGTLQQQIEPGFVEGGAYTLSWAGTAQARIGTGGSSPSGSYAASPITVTGAAAAQAIIVEFSTGSVGLVQLVPGSVAAPATTAGFLRRPYELSLCQRYYGRTVVTTGFDSLGIAVAFSTVRAAMSMQFPREMLAPPVLSAAGNFYLNGTSQIQFSGSNISFGTPNTSRVQVNIDVSGATAGQPYLMNAYNDTTAYIDFSAEN